MSKKSAHTKCLEKIANNPSDFGITEVRSFVIEQKLFDKRGKIIAEPDIVFFCFGEKGSEVIIIEYKGNGNGEYQERAQEQITIVATWYAKNTPYEPGRIHSKIIAGNDAIYKNKLR